MADIAVGSGAFLVAAARYLADRLVEAWTLEGSRGQSLRHKAIREIVARCLYGADINEMAIEMCKLSLWLVSLEPKLPFSFVDDKIVHGNSLLGITELTQLQSLRYDPSEHPHQHLFSTDIRKVIDELIQIRRELATQIQENDPQRSGSAKHNQLKRFREAKAKLAQVADGIIAAGLRVGGKPGKALDAEYENLAEAVKNYLPTDESIPSNSGMLEAIIEAGLTPTVSTDYPRWKPVHWVLEIPDVMTDHSINHGGFDAIIGNPPFLGGSKLSSSLGSNIREWFVYQIAHGIRGNADLVAYFFLRAFSLLKPTGTLGLIATNTIAQGDTREVGLDQLVSDGLTITRAVQSKPWPLASANLEYAAVWGTKSTLHPEVAKEVSGTITHSITTLLEPETRLNFIPERLLENERISFEGVKLTGMGFIVEQWQAREWIAKDTRNEKVLFPYLNGHDMNSRPDCSPSRWVIDFNNLSEEHAATYTQPFARVKGLVKPERDKNKRKVRRERWWQFAERQPGMRQAISELNEILAITLVSKTVMPMRVSTGQIFSHAVGLFATDSFIDQAVLSSTLHQMWAITYGSSMGMAPRYTPSDVFLTFPRPQPTPQLDEIGRTLDRERREIMLDRQLGVTKLYNLINDPQLPDSADADIARMRQIHRELDEIVMHAYGWADVQLEHGFHTYRQMTRWTVSSAARVEILDRLLEKNLRRANEQPQKAGAKAKKTSKAPAPDDRQGTLL